MGIGLGLSVAGNYIHGKTPVKENLWLFSIVVLLVAAFAGVVWPTVYRYEQATWTDNTRVLIKIHRITGDTYYYTPNNGWNQD